jgi:hypothetical protein
MPQVADFIWRCIPWVAAFLVGTLIATSQCRASARPMDPGATLAEPGWRSTTGAFRVRNLRSRVSRFCSNWRDRFHRIGAALKDAYFSELVMAFAGTYQQASING